MAGGGAFNEPDDDDGPVHRSLARSVLFWSMLLAPITFGILYALVVAAKWLLGQN